MSQKTSGVAENMLKSLHQAGNRKSACRLVHLVIHHLPDVIERRIDGTDDEILKKFRVLALENGRITVACGAGAVALLTVLPEGKKRMSAADFINGRKISVGDLLN